MKGLGAKSRERLAQVLRATGGTISPDDAAKTLYLSSLQSSKLLSFWAKQGWLRRVGRGVYIPVPLDALTDQIVAEDPWLVAERMFSPCYIGGWSAAEHWDLTEQIFSSVFVYTAKHPRVREQDLAGTRFVLRTKSLSQSFGLKAVWRGKTKVMISDPSRTIVDALSDPTVGGGIRNIADWFSAYLRSEHRDVNLLLRFAEQSQNATVFKRLGFFLERFAPEEKEAIETCLRSLSQGNSKLDPALPKDALITRWKLWVPSSWRTGVERD